MNNFDFKIQGTITGNTSPYFDEGRLILILDKIHDICPENAEIHLVRHFVSSSSEPTFTATLETDRFTVKIHDAANIILNYADAKQRGYIGIFEPNKDNWNFYWVKVYAYDAGLSN